MADEATLAAAATGVTALALMVTTAAFMARARRRAKGPAWARPGHSGSLAVSAALLTAGAALGGHWLLAPAFGAVAVALAALAVQQARLLRFRRELTRRMQQLAEAERLAGGTEGAGRG